MSGLKPVAFNKPRGHEPRLTEPYVPGRRAKRFWTEEEDRVLRERYPEGGVPACQPHLPAHHASARAIYQRVTSLGIAKLGRAPRTVMRDALPEDFEERLREAWATMDTKRKGAVSELADRFGVPRHWISQAALRLGLTVAHTKEPRWTAAEDELMGKVPLHDPKRASIIFREHGFARTPTAIVVRAKRLALSRRATHEGLTSRAAARILGVDDKFVTSACLSGDLVAKRREDQRLIQQGGSAWSILPADLRQFVIDHLDRIDIRKVDKIEFVHLLVDQGAAP